MKTTTKYYNCFQTICDQILNENMATKFKMNSLEYKIIKFLKSLNILKISNDNIIINSKYQKLLTNHKILLNQKFINGNILFNSKLIDVEFYNYEFICLVHELDIVNIKFFKYRDLLAIIFIYMTINKYKGVVNIVYNNIYKNENNDNLFCQITFN